MKPEVKPLKDPVPVCVFHIPPKQAHSTRTLLSGQRMIDFGKSMMYLAQKHNILGFCTPNKRTLELYFYFKREEDLLGFCADFKKLLDAQEDLAFVYERANHPVNMERADFKGRYDEK
jgi:hypothetical protein